MQPKSASAIEKPAGTSKYDMRLRACTATRVGYLQPDIYSVRQADRDVSLMHINRKYQLHVHVYISVLSFYKNIYTS